MARRVHIKCILADFHIWRWREGDAVITSQRLPIDAVWHHGDVSRRFSWWTFFMWRRTIFRCFFWSYYKVCFLKEIFSCFCGHQNRLYEAKHDVFLTLLLLVADKVWISWWHTKLVPAVYVSLPFAGFSSTKGWLEVLQSLVEEGREVWGNYKSVLFAQRPHFLLDQPSSLCEFSASESPDNYSTRSPCERYSQRLFRCPKGCCAQQIHFMIQFKRG